MALELIQEKDIKVDKIIEHHTKYKEIHGENMSVLMPRSEHIRLHIKLRRDGKCNIPPAELRKISNRANRKSRGSPEVSRSTKKRTNYKPKNIPDWIRKDAHIKIKR